MFMQAPTHNALPRMLVTRVRAAYCPGFSITIFKWPAKAIAFNVYGLALVFESRAGG